MDVFSVISSDFKGKNNTEKKLSKMVNLKKLFI